MKKLPDFIVEIVEKYYKINRPAYDMFSSILRAITGSTFDNNERKKLKMDKNDYPFIANSPERIHMAIDIARYLMMEQNININKLYDIGSGIGNVLFLAKYFCNFEDHQLIGIEKYHREGFHFYQPDLYCDILKIPENYFDKNSIIYLYNPLCDYEVMQEGLNHIVKVANESSTIVFVQASNATLEKCSPRKNSELYKAHKYGIETLQIK